MNSTPNSAPARLPAILNGDGHATAAEAPSPAPGLEALVGELRRLIATLECPPHAAMEPLAIGREEFARLLGVSVATLDRWESAGLVGPVGVKKNGRRLYALDEAKSWVLAGMPARKEWTARKGARK